MASETAKNLQKEIEAVLTNDQLDLDALSNAHLRESLRLIKKAFEV